MSEPIFINIADDFSAYPVGRDRDDSEKSNGKKFREEHLIPALNQALREHTQLIVSLEGVESIGSSFLEEAFGGVVRNHKWSPADLRSILRIEYEWAGYARAERSIWDHIKNAKPSA